MVDEIHFVDRRKDLAERNRLKGIFWHESRSPLVGLVSASRLLFLKGNLNSNQEKRVEIIQENSEKILDYINDIYDSDSLETQNDYWSSIKNYLLNLEINIKNLEKEDFSDKSKEYFNYMPNYFKRIKRHYELCKLRSLSKEELEKNSSNINLESIATEAIGSFKENLDEYNIEIKLDKDDTTDLTGHSNAVYAMFTTLLGNSLNFAPENSEINLRIKNRDNGLMVETKNACLEKPRGLHGTNKGLGTPYVRDLAESMGGTFASTKRSKYFKTKTVLPKNL